MNVDDAAWSTAQQFCGRADIGRLCIFLKCPMEKNRSNTHTYTGLSTADCIKVEQALEFRQAKLKQFFETYRPSVEELEPVGRVHPDIVTHLGQTQESVTNEDALCIDRSCKGKSDAGGNSGATGSTNLLAPGVRVVSGQAGQYRDLRLKVRQRGWVDTSN